MLQNLENAPGARKNRKRVGRGPGSTDGKTCGRGHNGYLSRSGSTKRIGFEGGQMPLHIRLPKRGFTNIFRVEFLTVNVAEIEACEKLDKSQLIDVNALRAAGLVGRKELPLKVLGNGDIKSKISVKVDKISASAKEKIEKAGGSVELIPSGRA
ncbi:MAG: 50S ribosomal protein L15 [SAR324 cluster bacterium]|nr:50S ribosomal protein L15 [SAR324 cluster bacterium]